MNFYKKENWVNEKSLEDVFAEVFQSVHLAKSKIRSWEIKTSQQPVRFFTVDLARFVLLCSLLGWAQQFHQRRQNYTYAIGVCTQNLFYIYIVARTSTRCTQVFDPLLKGDPFRLSTFISIHANRWSWHSRRLFVKFSTLTYEWNISPEVISFYDYHPLIIVIFSEKFNCFIW